MKNHLMPLNLQFFGEEEVDVSENSQEVAEPEDTEVSDAVEEPTEPTEDEESTPEPEVQSAEENARYAAARRQAEQEIRNRDAEFARRFKDYQNPITHKPILSERDYFEALDAQETLKRNEELRSKGVDPQMFEDMVNRQVANNPVVLQSQAVMATLQQAQIQNTMENDLKAIQKLNPEIKNAEDLTRDPSFGATLEYFNKGLSMPDAYKLANYDKLIANNNASAKQRTLNNLKGTQHLNQTDGLSSNDDGGVDIPQDELGAWKRAFPDLSMKDLKAKYNRTLNN